jgi:hypothetical protein
MLQGWKTYIAAVLIIVTGVLAQTNWVDFIANPKAGVVAIATAVFFAIMRAISVGPGGIQIIMPKRDTASVTTDAPKATQ